MSEIVLGVTGGIASYKAAELLRLFTESGHSVRVVPTESSLKFVGAATWEALSGKPVQTGVFDNVDQVAHVRIGQLADLIVIAPATANTLAKAAHGLADDLLTTTLLTARCPIVFVPAMHTEMWEHAATQANVSTLRSRGNLVVEPAVGRLTGKDSGKGRMPDPQRIFEFALQALERRAHDLAGKHVLISAGGSREYLDPVRFLGNRSSGRQGFALAEAAIARGAVVTVVAANVKLPAPAGVEMVTVVSTEELRRQMHRLAPDADAIVMAAAPADFRPATCAEAKIKKNAEGIAPVITLVENPDILVELVTARMSKRPVIVGFAAETGDANATVIEHAQAKLVRKGCDLLVVNDVSGGRAFEQADNEAVILGVDGSVDHVPFGPKIILAHAIWDAVAQRLD
ncbi:MAG: bifunctional phosphopantothenoylcysteine decarboxylase/phosphopantothenate--cysteine ligase CoaBC [Kineosporiaceae bacterium]|nr:bifunctional phosphopantothenoylcysteine decarboxylase/phosphopantothenate--cysteine ligase CoaBC [Aeromicrobium sp.]